MTMSQHADLSQDLADLRASVRTLAEMADARVESTLAAWFQEDGDLADSLRNADDEIDRLEVRIEEACLEILEQRAPKGADLRLVVGTLRIVAHLERIADLSRSIAKRVLRTRKRGDVLIRPDELEPMANQVRGMMRDVKEAIESEDAQLARLVRRGDPRVDELNRAISKWAIVQIRESPSDAEALVDMLVQVRALERIGDLCTNAAEDIMFIVGGEIVRHTPL